MTSRTRITRGGTWSTAYGPTNPDRAHRLGTGRDHAPRAAYPPGMAEILDEDAAARRAAAVLAELAALGVHAGDRVAVLAGSGDAFVAARDAATAADLVLAPINPRLAPAEVAWIVSH